MKSNRDRLWSSRAATVLLLLGALGGSWRQPALAQWDSAPSGRFAQEPEQIRSSTALTEFDRVEAAEVSRDDTDAAETGTIVPASFHGRLLSDCGPQQCGPARYTDSCGAGQSGMSPAPCIDCPHVSTLAPYFNVRVFGAMKLDMLFSDERPVAAGTPFFLLPDFGRYDTRTVDIHGRQSTLGAALIGPQVGDFQMGGQVLAVFYDNSIVQDLYGVLPLQAWGELKNTDWRFAAGLQFDVFNPLAPTVLPFSILGASGNSGNAFRGQVRLERYLYPAEDSQLTLQMALSEPVPTTLDPAFGLSEDNGWPNVEGRVALGFGAPSGPLAQRPVEVGLSGLLGQFRTTPLPPQERVVVDVWGLGADVRWRINEVFGVQGEFFSGRGLGTYNAGILQSINSQTLQGIRSTGGWFEGYAYLTPQLHTHVGYGVDNPDDADLDPSQRTWNSTIFANLLWDVNASFRVGFEFTHRRTEYVLLGENDGNGFHTQFQWTF